MEKTRWPRVYRRGKRFPAVTADKRWKTFDTATEAHDWKTEQDAKRKRQKVDAALSDPLMSEVLDAHAIAHERDWKPLTKTQRSSLRRIHVDDAIGERRVSELLSDREHLRALYRGVSPAQAGTSTGCFMPRSGGRSPRR